MTTSEHHRQIMNQAAVMAHDDIANGEARAADFERLKLAYCRWLYQRQERPAVHHNHLSERSE